MDAVEARRGEIVIGAAFGIHLEYWKMVIDVASEEAYPAPTWQITNIGTAGLDGGGAFILSGLAGYMDQFLVAYLRVNESACD